MRFLILTDIEGVTGVTTYQQAENSSFGRNMLMHDLLCVIDGIRQTGKHEIVIWDMHTDGRNIDLEQLPGDIQAVIGKPINGSVYKSVDGLLDGLFVVGLHAMAGRKNGLLAHTYLTQYDSIHINGRPVGEIGVEAMLAGEQGIPLVFLSGDDLGCAEAKELVPDVTIVPVKKSLGPTQALCMPPNKTGALLKEAAKEAAARAAYMSPLKVQTKTAIRVAFSKCRYLEIMKHLHPDLFVDETVMELCGDGMLKTWSAFLEMEREMVAYDLQ